MGRQPVDIVLVEDNEADVELTLRAFKQHNITNRIVTLRDGEEALDYFFARGKFQNRPEQKQPKLVLLDLKLPKFDGLEVLRELRNHEKTRLMPVVVLTSSREEKDLVASYELGVNSYIVKPVDFEQFVQAVKELGLYWLILNQTPDKEI